MKKLVELIFAKEWIKDKTMDGYYPVPALEKG
jgi:hypothetical protein